MSMKTKKKVVEKNNRNIAVKKTGKTRDKQNYSERNNEKRQPSSMPTFGRKALLLIWNLVFYMLMFSLLLGSVMIAIMQQQDKSFNGYRMFGVLTNSMVSPDNTLKAGGFRAGDLLMIKEIPEENVKVGDVITYRPSTNPTNKSTNYLTHRVVKINDRLGDEKGLFFVTRGDANKTDDMPISAKALVGKVLFRIPKIGSILAFIRENWLVSLIFIASILGFIWVMRIYILSGSNSSKKPRKKMNPNKKSTKKHKKDITSLEVNINKKKHTNRRKHK